MLGHAIIHPKLLRRQLGHLLLLLLRRRRVRRLVALGHALLLHLLKRLLHVSKEVIRGRRTSTAYRAETALADATATTLEKVLRVLRGGASDRGREEKSTYEQSEH